jgi:hypothetical protein
MLRPYNSFAEAVQAADVQTYLQDLRKNHPPEAAQKLLDSLPAQSSAAKAGPEETQAYVPPGMGRVESPIPPTAPLFDVTSRASNRKEDLGGAQRQEQRSAQPALRPGQAEPYPVREEKEAVPANRPLAQPAPGRLPVGRAVPNGPVPLGRPVAPPVAQPTALPTEAPTYPLSRISTQEMASPASAPRARRESEPPGNSGIWLNMLLVGVMLTVAMALAAFTLARPFLPAD